MVFQPSREFLLEQLATVKRDVHITSVRDERVVADLETSLASLAKRHRRLARTRNIVFVLIYASVLSSFALPVLTEVADIVTLITNVFGVGVLSVVALYLTWRLGQLWNRMLIIGTRLFAIYEQHSDDPGRVQHHVPMSAAEDSALRAVVKTPVKVVKKLVQKVVPKTTKRKSR